MPSSKIVNEQEVIYWIEEGRTYKWIVEEYRRKYNIETTISMWGNLRRRRGIDTRIVHDEDLIPWQVEERHRWAYPAVMLRAAGRRRAGREIGGEYSSRLDTWLRARAEDDTVVHYDPDTDEGWFYVPRRPGVDTDLIRVPDGKAARGGEDS
ncbi:hypothetical protein [Planosporangium thailandense]|uniref:hypothetical protein n=1 Tax=Planosporangium thailandense TaxID=765197 RepID=UPI001F1162C4|nr:hypothetical protein [Planosporangium thailandense]